MSAVDNVLNVARGELGYVEGGGPHGDDGNITKYWADTEPKDQGQPWCADFVSWVFKHAGAPLPAIDHPFGFTYCPSAQSWAQRNGRWLQARSPRVGAVVIFQHPGEKVAGHTGIVESIRPDGIVTIEGNTSSDDKGSQVNGGGVYRRFRPFSGGSLIILGYLWPPSLDGSAATTGDPFMALSDQEQHDLAQRVANIEGAVARLEAAWDAPINYDGTDVGIEWLLKNGIRHITTKVDNLAAGGVDLDALAKKVADEISKRMAA